MFVAYFGLIILNVEILSLFGAITKNNIFIFSILNFILTFAFWRYKKFPLLKINVEFKKIKNAMLLDKSLIVLGFGFLFMMLMTLLFAFVMPPLEPDSQTYHFIRAVEFFEYGKLTHFETGDIRALVMPINSEIVYTWMYALKNNFHGYGLVSYAAFVGGMFAVFDIFLKFKVPYRKILWTVFIFSSFPAVIVQVCTQQTDIIVGSLFVVSAALFLKRDKFSIYFSSLAFSIALGVKSTAVMATTAFFILLAFFEYFLFKDKKFKNLGYFILFSFFNFIIFSSYNYVLNFIHFHNPVSNYLGYISHKFWGGYKGFIANLIHYFFQAFDFTGFKWGFYLNDKIMNAKNIIFEMLNIPPSLGCNIAMQKVNILADEQLVGFGILGFILYLPAVIYSVIRGFFTKNKKRLLYLVFGLMFFINIIFLSLSVGYMVYSIRFILTFVFISLFCIASLYPKKSLFKPVIIFFAIFYMLFLSTNIARMPAKYVLRGLKRANYNIEKFEDDCFRGKITNTLQLAVEIYDDVLKNFSDKKRIAVFKTTSSSLLYLKSLSRKGYKVDFLVAANLDKYDLSKYDLIVFENEIQDDNIFNPEDVEINYDIKDTIVKFHSTDKVQCTYQAKENNADLSLTRSCLGYDYVKRSKIFKEALTTEFVPDEKSAMATINLHYFVKI